MRRVGKVKRGTLTVGIATVLGIAAGVYWYVSGRYHGMFGWGGHHGGAMHRSVQRRSDDATISVPDLTAEAKAGEAVFNESCSVCHGTHAAGTDQGPPLVHVIYEPSHHGDPSFYLAVANGVRGHHWRFGNMPKIEGVDQDEVTRIIAYVRELQRANGID